MGSGIDQGWQVFFRRARFKWKFEFWYFRAHHLNENSINLDDDPPTVRIALSIFFLSRNRSQFITLFCNKPIKMKFHNQTNNSIWILQLKNCRKTMNMIHKKNLLINYNFSSFLFEFYYLMLWKFKLLFIIVFFARWFFDGKIMWSFLCQFGSKSSENTLKFCGFDDWIGFRLFFRWMKGNLIFMIL
jgi:hypothetical protein